MDAVQTKRGCPFDCEFCDVIYLFGRRRTRHKPIEKGLKEIVTLQRLGMARIFFSDDNFIGNPRHAKDLLRELIPLNNSFRSPITFNTQLAINVAKDDELLELLARAKGMVSGVTQQPHIPKRKLQWKRLFQVLQFLHLVHKEVRQEILDVLWYTHRPAHKALL